MNEITRKVNKTKRALISAAKKYVASGSEKDRRRRSEELAQAAANYWETCLGRGQ